MSTRVDWRSSCSLTGTILRWLAVPLLFPLGVAVYYREDPVPFVVTILLTAAVGAGLERLRVDRSLGPREAFLMVALTWLGIALVGAVPFVVAGQGTIAHPVNALFESMSGITTTGATVLLDFEVHSRSVLMWRQLVQWLGGLGILVLATAVLSQLSVGGAQLMETETQTRNVNKLTPQIEQTARLLGAIYLVLTALTAAALYALYLSGVAPNMTPYQAVAHAFTSVATAGFSPKARSVEAFVPAVQWLLVPAMAIGATNFVLVYHVSQGDYRRLRDSEEFRFYLGVLAAFSAAIVLALFLDPTSGGVEETVRHAVFQVVSIVTTTGYASTNFDLWTSAGKHLLFVCMFIGGMAGSTTCSIKTVRWLVVLKSFRRDLFTSIHPEAIRPVRLSGDVIDEGTVRDIYAYTLLNLVIFFLATVYVAVDASRVAGLNVSEFEAMGAAASAFLNIGPAFGIAGPFGSYVHFPASTKLVLTFLMWLGRIEVIPVLVLLTRAFWRS